MLGNGIAIVTGMAGISHKVCYLLFLALLPQFADMQPMASRIFTLEFFVL